MAKESRIPAMLPAYARGELLLSVVLVRTAWIQSVPEHRSLY